jgi:hypothetical protein
LTEISEATMLLPSEHFTKQDRVLRLVHDLR